MDWLWGGLGMVLASFFLTLFIGRIKQLPVLAKELELNSSFFKKISPYWIFHVKYIIPILISIIIYGIFN